MFNITFIILFTVLQTIGVNMENPDPNTAKSIYEFTAKDIDGNDVSLEKYR